MKEFLVNLRQLREDGFTFSSDQQTKEVLMVKPNPGYRHSICTINTLPKAQGFLFKDTGDAAVMIAGFLNNLSEPEAVTPSEEIELKAKQRLSSVELLKTSIRDDIYSFIDDTESPVLRDTVVGMLTSLTIEFATNHSNEE